MNKKSKKKLYLFAAGIMSLLSIFLIWFSTDHLAHKKDMNDEIVSELKGKVLEKKDMLSKTVVTYQWATSAINTFDIIKEINPKSEKIIPTGNMFLGLLKDCLILLEKAQYEKETEEFIRNSVKVYFEKLPPPNEIIKRIFDGMDRVHENIRLIERDIEKIIEQNEIVKNLMARLGLICMVLNVFSGIIVTLVAIIENES